MKKFSSILIASSLALLLLVGITQGGHSGLPDTVITNDLPNQH